MVVMPGRRKGGRRHVCERRRKSMYMYDVREEYNIV